MAAGSPLPRAVTLRFGEYTLGFQATRTRQAFHVTSETLRGHGIEEVDELLKKLSGAWMLALGKYIRGD